MKGKIRIIVPVIIILLILGVFGGYQLYRRPAMIRRLTDRSLDDAQTESLKTEILARTNPQILVAYFSYTGTTKSIAQAISEKTGADLFEIIPGQDYGNVYTESNREIRLDEHPALKDSVEDMEKYNIVFVGFPIWWHATPAPVYSFLSDYDLTGKLVIPFCTSVESPMEEAMPTFLNESDNLAVYGERRITGTEEINSWLDDLGITAPDTETVPEMPEAIQKTGNTVKAVEDLPVYRYEQKEISVTNQGQSIYGVAYIPQTEQEKVPFVILAHGLGGSYQNNLAYAEQLASHGVAAYTFDFRGGGGSRSEGSSTEMSVMTEVSDMEVVLDAAKEWEFVDTDRIALLGTSQGGAVSAITAARHPDEIAGAMLLYPAFLVSDAVHEQFDSLEEVPDTFLFNWIMAGKPYVEDMWDYDVYDEIGNYNKKVLLMHGSADGIVPISYSERAADTYQDVEYFVIDGAGHGFSGSAFDESVGHIFDYLQETEILKNT